MNTITITIFSIIISAVIAYIIAKWQMSRNKIAHFYINSYDIGKGLSQDFPEFKLTFNGDELSDNVCVIKGGLMNIGMKDIDGLNGISDVQISLPEGCSVKAIKVTPSNRQLRIHTEFNGNNIDFGINELFVSDEYFEYTAIIDNIDNPQNINFSHRIKDTKKEIENIVVGPDFIKDDAKTLKSITTVLYFLGIPTGFYLWKSFEAGKLAYILLSIFFSIFFVLSLYIIIFKGKDKRHVIRVLRRAKKETSNNHN